MDYLYKEANIIKAGDGRKIYYTVGRLIDVDRMKK